MKKTFRTLVYPLVVMTISLFVLVGCDDDDTSPGNDIDYGSVTDIDGNEYKTVTIGSQEWMAENLRVTRYNNGSNIPTGLTNAEWIETTSGAYAIYDHTANNTVGIDSSGEMVNAYGILYNWFAVEDERGLCPDGWSMPSDDDWTQLVNYLISQGFENDHESDRDGAGNALKSCRQVGSPEGSDCDTPDHPRWNNDVSHHGFDEFGFAAIPAGIRSTDGNYGYIGSHGSFWSSCEHSIPYAHSRSINSFNGNIIRGANFKRFALSIRCVRNAN